MVTVVDRDVKREDRRNAVKSRSISCVRVEAENLTRVCLGVSAGLPVSRIGLAVAASLHLQYDLALNEPVPEGQQTLLDKLG